ncbi:MAG: alkaline phosphatase family protein [Longimicrobiales bacterium]
MRNKQKLILLEFNELTPALLQQFIKQGELPNFARFYRESLVYTTDAEESGETLNPWIQWVTVHSGLSYTEHGIFELNEGHKLKEPCLWDLLSAQGHRVWVCGSMNVRYDVPLNGYVLPDPWTVNVDPYPANAGLDSYFRFVQTQVQEHTNDQMALTASDYARFLKFMVSHGLSAHTTAAIVRQLTKERVGDGKWKRAVILDKLQFDVFRSIFQSQKPQFSTFFLNSTAHMQHAYWRYMDPEPFKVKPTEDERLDYGDAVLYGYQEMDGLLGRFLKLAGDDVTLVFATALGQQPCLLYEDTGGKRFYRPRDFERFLEFAGVTVAHKCSPVMSEQFHVHLNSEADAGLTEQRLRALQVDGRPLMRTLREGAHTVSAGAALFDAIPETAVLSNEQGRSVSFFEQFYGSETVKSGMHHPDGALWIRTPEREHRVFEDRVSLRSVAPTVLKMFGVEPPAFMKADALEWSSEKVVA